MRAVASSLATLSEGIIYEPLARGNSPTKRSSIHGGVTHHGANGLRGAGVTGHCARPTVRNLVYGDRSAPALPAMQCRPTLLGINILDQQQYSTHNPRYMVL
jgi:hypothetical protein